MNRLNEVKHVSAKAPETNRFRGGVTLKSLTIAALAGCAIIGCAAAEQARNEEGAA